MCARIQQNRRRAWGVETPGQKRLLRSVSLIPVCGLAVTLAFVAVFSHRLAFEALESGVRFGNLLPLFLSMASFAVLAGVFLLYNSVKVSKQVVGPVYRACQSLARIRSGDITFRQQLREDDYFEELNDEINRLLDWLNAHPPSHVSHAEPDEHDADDVASTADYAVAADDHPSPATH